MSLIDTSTNSPRYFYWKSIGTVNENLNFDLTAQRVKGWIWGDVRRLILHTSPLRILGGCQNKTDEVQFSALQCNQLLTLNQRSSYILSLLFFSRFLLFLTCTCELKGVSWLTSAWSRSARPWNGKIIITIIKGKQFRSQKQITKHAHGAIISFSDDSK